MERALKVRLVTTQFLFFVLATLLPLYVSKGAHDSVSVEQQVIVVKLNQQSTTAQLWIKNGRTGTIQSFTDVLGEHTTEAYISNQTFRALEQAHRRKSQLSQTPRPNDALYTICVVRYSRPIAPHLAARKISGLDAVSYAEPLPQHRISIVPNDPYVDQQYHLPLVKAFDAWDVLPSGQTITVGIIDTGIDTNHVDLGANVWRNNGELGTDALGRDKKNNGVDDDGNGFVDDHIGWDFVGTGQGVEDNAPMPGHLHGTHVAGIVAAIANNAIGISGVAINVRVMAVKVSRDDRNAETVSRVADGILYAAAMGASVINCSFGSPTTSFAEYSVIEEALSLGSLVVAAAGNNGEERLFYPAAHPHVLSVASTDSDDELSTFTNRHATVDVCAPGTSILSTIPGNAWDNLSGTSMASPVVAAIAAMVRLKNPALSPDETLATIVATADAIDTLPNILFLGTYGSGRANAFKAVSSTSARRASVVKYSIGSTSGNQSYLPLDTLRLTVHVVNDLAALANARIVISVAPAAFSPTITNASFTIGALAKGEQREIDLPTSVLLPIELPLDGTLRLLALIYDDTTVVGRSLLTATVNPTYKTLTVNDIRISVNSTGNLGYNDYPDNLQGVGMTYRGSESILFEGALMIGTEPRYLPNVARGANTSRKDMLFRTLNVATLRSDSVLTGERIVTSFTDDIDPDAVGVTVEQNVYALENPDAINTVIVNLDVTNRTSLAINNLYVSEFFDVDIGAGGAKDGCAWNRNSGIGFVQNTTRTDLPAFGVAMISPLPVNFFAVDNDGSLESPSIYDHFLRSEKWLTMSGGVRRTNSLIGDVSAVIGAGPFSLQPGESQSVVFVIASGYTYAQIENGIKAATAHAISQGLNASIWTPQPLVDNILFLDGAPLVSPGSSTIRFATAQSTPVLIDIIDLFGTTVTTLVNELHLTSGIHERGIEIPSVSSGCYFVRMISRNGKSIFPFGLKR